MTKQLHLRLVLLTVNSFLSILIPPFAPPNGTPTTAHLNVISMANAFTSSMSTPFAYLMPKIVHNDLINIILGRKLTFR